MTDEPGTVVAVAGQLERVAPGKADPVAAYLGRLRSRRTKAVQLGALEAAAGVLLGQPNTRGVAASLPWWQLQHEHVAKLRGDLLERYAPATVRRTLSAVRGVLEESWAVGLMAHDDYARAIRTKPDREHRLPLSPLAVSIFRDAIALADAESVRRADRNGTAVAASEFVFPAAKGAGPINSNAGTRAMDRNRDKLAGAGIVESFNTHDLRRTVATHLGEMEYPDEVIERILNHAPRSTAGRHYNHAKHMEPMRRALEWWGSRVQSITEGRDITSSNVVPMRREALGA